MIIESQKIEDMNHVKEILDKLAEYVRAYEEQIGAIPEYILEDIEFQICEVDAFIIGPQKLTSSNLACADIRMMLYWEYIDNKCDFWNMVKRIKKNEGEV